METKLFKVGISQIETGHVFKPDLTLYLGEGDYFVYFDSVREAILFSNQLVKEHPEFECWISNDQDEMVYFKSRDRESFY